MRDFEELRVFVKKKEFLNGLSEIQNEIEEIRAKKSFSYIKKYLGEISSEEDFYTLIQLLDEGLMPSYSTFIVRYAHRRFNSFRTLTWFCDDLIDERKSLDAEDLLKEALQKESHAVKKEHLAKAYFVLARCVLEMRRYEEAYTYMKKADELSEIPIFDKWGYFYLFKGDWLKAEEVLRKGMTFSECADTSTYLLAELYSMKGEHEESLQIITEAMRKFPQVPFFYLEKTKRLYDQKAYDELSKVLREVQKLLPFHSYQPYFSQIWAEFYYMKGDWTTLQTLLENEKSLKDSPYHNALRFTEKKEVMLSIVPVVQKDNYCVPASVEMILKLFGNRKTQDEIAKHIFDGIGSKLSKTVEYVEANGYKSRFFVGTVDVYKKFIDAGVPILLSVDIDHVSHVQLVVGYNDQLQVLYIQDPNFAERILVTYEEFVKQHVNTNYLSIAIVPKEKSELLSLLCEEDDYYFRRIFSLTDQMEFAERDDVENLLRLLHEHKENPYTWLYAIKHLDLQDGKEFVYNCAKRALHAYPESDYVKLHTAQCFVRIEELEQAYTVLEQVNHKIANPFYHFTQGRIAFDESRYDDMIANFRASLQLDPDQPVAWSYMAIGYMYLDDLEQALKYSSIATCRHEDRFVFVNHALILTDAGHDEEAYEVFTMLLKQYKRDGFVWCERARCAHKLGKIRSAIRGLQVGKELDRQLPLPYIMLADIYEAELDDERKAEEVLLEGMQNDVQSAALYVKLGDLYLEREQYEKALKMYEGGLQCDEEEISCHIGISEVYMKQKGYETGKQYIFRLKEQFIEDSDFLINAGKILWNAAIDQNIEQKEVESALLIMEEGIVCIQSNFRDALEMYVSQLEDTPLLQRGISFLRTLVEKDNCNIDYLCYLGILQESAGNYKKAIQLYEQATQITEDPFPHFRLGEVYKTFEEWDQAKTAYLQCVKQDSTFAMAHLKLAEIYYVEEDLENEQHYMFEGCKNAPLLVNMEHLANISVKTGRHGELITVLNKKKGIISESWRLNSLAYVYGATGDGQKERAYIEQALAKGNNHEEILHHYAKILLASDEKEGLNVIEKLILKNVHNEEVYVTYIEELRKRRKSISNSLGDLDILKEEKSYVFMYAASALEQRFLEQMEQEEQTGAFFTKIYHRIRKRANDVLSFTSIIDLYETAIRLNQENGAAVQRFAHFYVNGDLIDDAIKTLRKSLGKHWNYEVAHQFIMLLLEHADDNEARLQEALRETERILQERPIDASIRMLEGTILLDLQREKEGEYILRTLAEDVPMMSGSFIHLGALYNNQGRYREAIAILEKGLAHHPEEDELYIGLGVSHHLNGDTERALQLMNDVLSMDESHLNARYNKACYLAVLNRNEEATVELERVLQEDESGYFAELMEEDPDLIRIKKYVKQYT
ncbi:tetratricopeptide repeat protein [Bacillus sp. UNC322MFChir4.1]|uniref:tetratricopeptide repeat protein n=1 Tax=Bacillus sp. UNC322MFChir4.1 TaxID=1449045 RepID=UPI00054E7FA3|nr:tetratricopeptide repeat protein [Bacillus sp. UNC322MFChir4.1]